MDIALALSTASQVIGLAKTVKDMDSALLTAEYKGKMAEIISAMADVTIALSDAKLRIADLESQVTQLKTHNADLIKVEGFSYDKDQTGNARGMPYCPDCQQRHGMFLKLHQNTNIPGHPYYCGSCKTVFGRSLNRS
jgi:hypothetical protein